MSLVQGGDGQLVSINIASTIELEKMLAEMTLRLQDLHPDGDEYRWVAQEIELLEEELEARNA